MWVEFDTPAYNSGHCRRRKIRCVASADAQGGCVSCVRLVKKCIFSPVEQQPRSETPSKAYARQVAGSNNTSTDPVDTNPMSFYAHTAEPYRAAVKDQGTLQRRIPRNVEAPGQCNFVTQPWTDWMVNMASASISMPENLEAFWPSYAEESPWTQSSLRAQWSPSASSRLPATSSTALESMGRRNHPNESETFPSSYPFASFSPPPGTIIDNTRLLR